MDSDLQLFHERLIYEKNYSSHTITAYLNDIQEFLNIVDVVSWEDVSPLMISHWIEQLSHLAPRSITRKISSLRSFYDFLVKLQKIPHNPFALFKSVKATKHIPTVPSVAEMSALLFSLPTTNSLEIRNKMMLILFYITGIRSEELCSLKLNSIEHNGLRVLGKGNKERIVPLIPLAREVIDSWLEVRKELDKHQSPYLFLSQNGRPLTSAMIRKIVSTLDLKSRKKMHPHAFRYSYASHLLEGGADIRHIQELLGHASISATQRYTKLSIRNLHDNYQKFHPRG